MFDFLEIVNPGQKSQICNLILRALPSWFGVEASIIDYTETTRSMPFFAAFDGDSPVGFVAIKIHYIHTAELCVMGVLPEYHRQGAGEKLIRLCEGFCRNKKIEYLTVKTLDESRESGSYEKTRRFYFAMGFKPLEVFPLIWDKDNPCLLMVKYLGGKC